MTATTATSAAEETEKVDLMEMNLEAAVNISKTPTTRVGDVVTYNTNII